MSGILTKEFSLGDVLSITTGRLVSERHMDGVYDILNWMTGDNLFTHQLPRAAEACAPVLCAQLSRLNPEENAELKAEVEGLIQSLEGLNEKAEREAAISAWLVTLKAKYGDSFQIIPLKGWESRDPLAEAVEMFGADKVIAVSADEEPPVESEWPVEITP